jgi:hypothetical protein
MLLGAVVAIVSAVIVFAKYMRMKRAKLVTNFEIGSTDFSTVTAP